MVAGSVNFLENEGDFVSLGEKMYVVQFNRDMNSVFYDPPHIIVSGRKYPLEYKGYRLCDDLQYRKSLKDSLPFSGPHSAFIPVCRVPEEEPREAMRNNSL